MKMTMTTKITAADFAGNQTLNKHKTKSLAVAKALDAKADVLPHAIVRVAKTASK